MVINLAKFMKKVINTAMLMYEKMVINLATFKHEKRPLI
jgi:hypothetical protein